MPAGVVHSATGAHSAISAILTGLTDRSAIGFITSALVLATFGMKDMVNLRIVAICSNVAFIMYGFVLDLPPVLILHVMLLPLNGWRLVAVFEAKQRGCGALSFDSTYFEDEPGRSAAVAAAERRWRSNCRGIGQAQRHQSKVTAFSNIVLIGSTST